MPDDWEPPVPAWSVNSGGAQSLAVAYFGVQSHTNDTADSEADGRLRRAQLIVMALDLLFRSVAVCYCQHNDKK